MLHDLDRWSHSYWDGIPEQVRLGNLELEAVLSSHVARASLQHGKKARLARSIRGVRHLHFPDRAHLREPRLVFSDDGYATYPREFDSVTWSDLVGSHPVRDYSRHRGQKNKPIAFFSRTTGDLINCESRLERSFALVADFNPDVVHIAAQPCAIQFPVGDELRVHTMDFVVLALGRIPIAVDVKTAKEAADPKWIARHKRIRALLGRAGIGHFVWTGLPPTIVENLAYFSSAQVTDGSLDRVRDIAVSQSAAGTSAGLLAKVIEPHIGVWPATNGRNVPPSRIAPVLVRAMLWERTLTTDLTVPFASTSMVTAR
jgi:hypothetical protein